MNIRKLKGKTFFRKLELARASIDEDARTIEASLSSEHPVERFFGTEVLLHEKSAVNLERAGDNGLPLLFGHNHDQLIGRAREVRLKDKKLRARLDFSDNTKQARETWAEIRDGFLTDISLGYEINDIDERDDEVVVTRFTPLEASIVTVAADPHVGINRGHEMTKPTKPNQTGTDDGVTVADFKAAREKARGEGSNEGAKLERARVTDITRLFGMHSHRDGVSELMQECIDKGETAKRAAAMLLEFIAGEPEPAAGTREQSDSHHGQRIETVRDQADKWSEGVTEAIELRVGLVKGERADIVAKRQANQFTGMSLQELARDYLHQQRVDMSGMSRSDIAGMAFTRAGMHSTSDFANILENVANKSLMRGFDEAEETWRPWCRIGNLADFKEASRVNTSSFSDLEVVPETGEYKEGHVSDLKETIQLLTYGKTFTLSRQAIINDDTDALDRTPAAMGRAAARQVGDLAYSVLTANGTMNEDGVALFSTATHANLASSGAAISETTLDTARNAMAVQTSPAPGTGETGATLNITPRFLLVPSAKLMTAQKVVNTPTAPDTAGDLAVNTMFNRLVVISDARLDADSTTQWYVMADPNVWDTVEVAFLDGMDAPMLESENGFKQDGVTYKVRLDAAAAAIGWRGAYSNPGA